MNRRTARLAALAAGATVLTACGSASGPGTDTGSGGTDGADGRLSVLTSFYPLQYVAETVGGPTVDVSSLTPAGADAHDLELSPADVARVGRSDLVVYLGGFQSAVDDAVDQGAPARALDVAAAPGVLELDRADEETGVEHSDETDDGHGHADGDPHVWLDPLRLGAIARAVADELAAVDPDHAADHATAADELETELAALDEEFRTGLATCETRTIVVAHEAYGYLADAYDLHQEGISGVDPDAEPSPARLAEIGEVVRAEGVSTIFTESVVNPKVAETLAADLGVTTSVLDPLERLADQGTDYPAVMRANLTALRAGLGCE